MTDTKAKVLIVDDDPLILRLLSARCSSLGLEVQTAENGLQAILRATRNPPRVMILDLNMPEADGFRVCEWLLEAGRPAVDVIILTARSDMETRDRCKSLGAFHVLKGANAWEAVRSILGEVLQLEPSSLSPLPSPRHVPAEVDPPLTSNARNKVLIVEDDSDLAKGLARRLQKCGAVTLVASDGVSGYRMAVKERPDVIVTDYAMPDGSGHYMIWRLKSTDSTRDIPIIVISGQKRDGEADARMTQDAGLGGAVRYFQKPLNIDALLNEVSQHCVIQYSPFEAAH